jgi:hypothetical protein
MHERAEVELIRVDKREVGKVARQPETCDVDIAVDGRFIPTVTGHGRAKTIAGHAKNRLSLLNRRTGSSRKVCRHHYGLIGCWSTSMIAHEYVFSRETLEVLTKYLRAFERARS